VWEFDGYDDVTTRIPITFRATAGETITFTPGSEGGTDSASITSGNIVIDS
jgi:hypothetical protein